MKSGAVASAREARRHGEIRTRAPRDPRSRWATAPKLRPGCGPRAPSEATIWLRCERLSRGVDVRRATVCRQAVFARLGRAGASRSPRRKAEWRRRKARGETFRGAKRRRDARERPPRTRGVSRRRTTPLHGRAVSQCLALRTKVLERWHLRHDRRRALPASRSRAARRSTAPGRGWRRGRREGALRRYCGSARGESARGLRAKRRAFIRSPEKNGAEKARSSLPRGARSAQLAACQHPMVINAPSSVVTIMRSDLFGSDHAAVRR
jgi:hypothetical protein